MIIPSAAGPSSPRAQTPNTPATNLTRGTPAGTITSAPSVDDDYAGYDEGGSDREDGSGDDGVIRVEFGGETPEQRAKRIALALRK